MLFVLPHLLTALAAAGASCPDASAVVELLRSGMIAAAQESLGQHEALCRNDGDWHYLRARVFCQSGDYEAAGRFVSRAISLDSGAVEYHRFASTIFAKLGRTGEARDHVGLMIKLRSGSGNELQQERLLAVVLAQGGKTAAALQVLRALLDRYPNDVQALYYRALFEQSLAEYPNATIGYRRVLELDSTHAAARRQLAVIEIENGDIAGGLKALEQLLARKSEPELLFHIGRAKWKLGEFASAERAVRQAIEAAPAEARYRRQLGLMLLRAGSIAEGRWQIEEGNRMEGASLR